jgi:small subunit ribosomal protein S18
MPKTTKKPCPINAAGIKVIDYKDTTFLKQYLTKFNRIIPRYYSGVSLANQKQLAAAIKRARYMALLPYVLEVTRPSGAVLSQTSASVTSDATVLDESAVAL